MCSLATVLSIVFLPLITLGFIYAEQEFSAAFNQKKQFDREMAELESMTQKVRKNYDAF